MRSTFNCMFSLLACGLAFAFVAPVRAGEANSANTGMVPYKVGSIEVVAILDNQFAIPNDGKTFGVGAGPEAVSAALKAAGAPTNSITVPFGGGERRLE